jgi:hypothetical protein
VPVVCQTAVVLADTNQHPRRPILRSRIAPDELPGEMAISAVTLAELSAGPHEVRPDTEQDSPQIRHTHSALRAVACDRLSPTLDPEGV